MPKRKNKYKERAAERREEQRRAKAERLKRVTHENDMLDELRLFLVCEFGQNRADEILDRSYRVHPVYLFDDAYRINFWEDTEEKGKRIWFSTFVRYTKMRKFYFSDPSWELLREKTSKENIFS